MIVLTCIALTLFSYLFVVIFLLSAIRHKAVLLNSKKIALLASSFSLFLFGLTIHIVWLLNIVVTILLAAMLSWLKISIVLGSNKESILAKAQRLRSGMNMQPEEVAEVSCISFAQIAIMRLNVKVKSKKIQLFEKVLEKQIPN